MAVVKKQNLQEPQANIYQLGDLEREVGKTIDKWGRYIKEQLRNPAVPETEFHCTMRYDPSKDPKLEKEWLEETKEQEIPLIFEYLIVGHQREEHCKLKSAVLSKNGSRQIIQPHVSIYLNEGCQPKDLGPMMLHAKERKQEATENLFIFQTTDMMYLKIMYPTKMIGIPKMIVETVEIRAEF